MASVDRLQQYRDAIFVRGAVLTAMTSVYPPDAVVQRAGADAARLAVLRLKEEIADLEYRVMLLPLHLPEG